MRKLSDRIDEKLFFLKGAVQRQYRVFTRPQLSGKEADDEANVITIARVIGNDLYPRHADGQSVNNLEFILENEPNFPNCRKVFVINRFFDPAREKYAADRIRQCGHTALVIPFIDEEYAGKTCHDTLFDGQPYPADIKESVPLKGRQVQKRLWASADKICYAMNINGARNVALQDGRENGKWTILLDGSCFVSNQVFEHLYDDLFKSPITPYVIIAMERLQSNDLALTRTPRPNRIEEPQLAFHRDALESFDERYPYGMRDKTSLLTRIGVPGVWSKWKQRPNCGPPKDKHPSPERHHYKFANTCVFRLSSGVQNGRLEATSAQRERYRSRNDAIFQTLALLDQRVAVLQDNNSNTGTHN